MVEPDTSGDLIVAITALLSVGMGTFVKIASRNDRHKSFSRNDFAVGLDLMISAIIILITRSLSGNEKIPAPAIPGMLFILWLTSTFIRKLGWEDQDQLKMLSGVLIPALAGIISIIATVKFT